MPLRLGLIAYPLLAAGYLASRTGPVAKFIKAGATSPEHARRPTSLGIERPSVLSDPVRSGTLQRLADGRYFVDLAIVRRRRRRVLLVLSLVGLVSTILLLWLVPI